MMSIVFAVCYLSSFATTTSAFCKIASRKRPFQHLLATTGRRTSMSGRGEYYKNKYGGGGRGRGGGGGGGRGRGGGGRGGRGGRSYDNHQRSSINSAGGSYQQFLSLLDHLDGKQYGAYHDIETHQGWVHENFVLRIGRAQSDSFAAPTRCQVQIKPSFAQFPTALFNNKIRSIALSDYLHRALYAHAKEMGVDAALQGQGGWSGPKGGDIQLLDPCQHVLEQSAVSIQKDGSVICQMTINLPARGRTILGFAAKQIFEQSLVTLIQKALNYAALKPARLESHVNSIEDQVWLQHALDAQGLVAFVRDGAILPRASGVDDRPLAKDSIPFESPDSLRVSFQLPSTGATVTGMGFRKGISLICGGGFHGKSTLLEALQVGVYPKVPGDGREFCVTSPSAIKIRAEDGRSVTAVDISPFISNLPFGKDTTCFSTLDASGSTSQASNIIEAMEMGTNLLLVDEDTCATNFMIRDDKMIQLVAAEKEPITPFVRKVQSIYTDHGISSILVIGGSGDYFDVADTVVMMDCYKCLDVTARAKEIAGTPTSLPFGNVKHRHPDCAMFKTEGKVAVRSATTISYGDIDVDTFGLEQVVAKSQTAMIAQSFQSISSFPSGNNTVKETLQKLDRKVDEEGINALAPGLYHGGLSRARAIDIAGAMNRFRKDGSIKQ